MTDIAGTSRPHSPLPVGAEIGDRSNATSLRNAADISLVGLFAVALVTAAYFTGPVLLPVLIAWVLATVVSPVIGWLERLRLPRTVAAVLVALTLVAIIAALLLLLSNPISSWLGRTGEIRSAIESKLQGVSRSLATLETLRKALENFGTPPSGPVLHVEQQSNAAAKVVSVVTPAVSQLVLCIGALVFYLVYQRRLRQSLVLLAHGRKARLEILRVLTEIDAQMTAYFSTYAVVNSCLALLTTLLAWLVGLPNALLWGALAGVVNFIPYVGPAVVMVSLTLAGLLTFTAPADALTAPLIFLGMVGIEGQFITPTLMGRHLELNPFAIFLAIAFCAWLWGPLGAFVAVPLLLAASLTLSYVTADDRPELPD